MGPSQIRLGQTDLTSSYSHTDCASDGTSNFIPRACIREEIFTTHFIPSDHTESHRKYGTRKYYHLVVDLSKEEKEKEKKEIKIIENAAWYYEGPNAAELTDKVAFRITRSGDPGNPHFNMWSKSEGNGVTEVQDWFG